MASILALACLVLLLLSKASVFKRQHQNMGTFVFPLYVDFSNADELWDRDQESDGDLTPHKLMVGSSQSDQNIQAAGLVFTCNPGLYYKNTLP